MKMSASASGAMKERKEEMRTLNFDERKIKREKSGYFLLLTFFSCMLQEGHVIALFSSREIQPENDTFITEADNELNEPRDELEST